MIGGIEDWREADAIGSFNDAIAEIGRRVKAGESLPKTGYFARSRYVAPAPQEAQTRNP